MKRVLRILFFLFAFYLTERFCHRATDGFTLAKIAPLLDGYSNEVLLPDHFFTERFTYFDKGGQCYVFASENGEYILKFFRKNADLKQAFSSVRLAEEKISQETGLIYLHLGKTKQPLPHLQIVDKLNIAHTINLNTYSWFLQKRAHLVHSHLTDLMQVGKVEEAKQALTSLFTLLKGIAAKGVMDGDPNLTKNFGFIGKEPIEMDIGRFHLKAEKEVKPLKEPLYRTDRLMQSKEDLLHWLNAHYPILSPHLEEEFQRFSISL